MCLGMSPTFTTSCFARLHSHPSHRVVVVAGSAILNAMEATRVATKVVSSVLGRSPLISSTMRSPQDGNCAPFVLVRKGFERVFRIEGSRSRFVSPFGSNPVRSTESPGQGRF